ncbi:ankyrin repeat protein [Pseudozyma hubeiensis SY62]|uniref:Ankyrin repeat protein n=1 Tax=Pseudozyma hubeiensis (strain SY62) TaxID=1305764 RepID=R9PD62_PSEHS|nr:ankyrin repeat protein [Pseudozyma hubeiensis SY62]GAC99313.1 ankyrin repeat protein [Pseudozyma hubeiensis SY62]
MTVDTESCHMTQPATPPLAVSDATVLDGKNKRGKPLREKTRVALRDSQTGEGCCARLLPIRMAGFADSAQKRVSLWSPNWKISPPIPQQTNAHLRSGVVMRLRS